jgi:hypothetical protein
VAKNPPASPPKGGHPVDAFLDAKIEAALALNAAPSGDSGAFRKDILPILQDKCFRCHGEKNKGGLKLNSREAALRGGDSEIPSIVPASEGELLAPSTETNLVMRLRRPLSKAQIASWRRGFVMEQSAIARVARKLAKSAFTSDEAFLRRISSISSACRCRPRRRVSIGARQTNPSD